MLPLAAPKWGSRSIAGIAHAGCGPPKRAGSGGQRRGPQSGVLPSRIVAKAARPIAASPVSTVCS